jgi:hypothetical protein
VVGIRKSARKGALSWWINAVDSLHFGYWGGLTTKILWAVLGMGLPTLVLSGAYLSWRRAGVIGTGNPFRNRPAMASVPWWRRRPLRTWLFIPLIALIIVSVMAGYQKRSQAPEPFVDVADVEIGPWQARVIRETGAPKEEPVRYAVFFDAGKGEHANLQRATLTARTGELVDDKDGAELKGPPAAMRGALSLPASQRGGAPLRLTAESWTGEAYKAAFRDTASYRAGDRDRHYEPAASGVFFGIVYGYAIVSLLIAGVWFVLDIKPVRR